MTMKWSISCGVLAIVMAVSAAMAREPSKEDPNAPPTVREPSKEEPKAPTPARGVPTLNYIVASPRAFLAGAAMGRMIDYSAMTGAAENFARPALARARLVEVPVGTRVVFSLDPETEGVWMQGAHGMIGTLLTLQQLVVKDCAECDDNAAADADDAADSKRESQVAVQGRDSNDVAPPADPNDKTGVRRPASLARWIPLATDGVRDIRFGPSIGWAQRVSVPVRFDKAGVYCLRGIISTSVKSWNPRTAAKTARDRADEKAPDTPLMPDNLLAIDVDIVHICVRVLDQPAKDTGTDRTATDPNETTDKDTTHTRDMTKITGAEALDLDDDGLGDLGVLVDQQEGDVVLPLNEDIGN